jgi:polysaccharide biosynthesis transport protein
MEIKDLVLLMWRNIRYLLLGLVVGAGIGILVSNIQTPVYEATSKILVSRIRQQGSVDMLSLSDEQLLAINLQLAKSQPVLDDVFTQLGSRFNAENIQVSAIPNTLIVQIGVQDHDPQRAAAIANLLVETLIQRNEMLLSGRYLELESAIEGQLEQVGEQIDELEVQISQITDAGIQEQLKQASQQLAQLKQDISRLEQEIAGFSDIPSPLDRIALAEKQAQLDQARSLLTIYQQIEVNLTYIGKPGQSGSSLENPQLATLQATLGLYQQIHQTMINSLENVRLARSQSRQNVIQIVPATPPKTPVRPMPVLYFLLASVVGLALAATSILVFDHLDDSLKTTGQIEELLGLSVLGSALKKKHSRDELVTLHDPFSAESEAFRVLGASLQVVVAAKNIKTLMIVNADPADARTSVAANLAIISAQQGKQVILLDGDLKNPHIHTLFGMDNHKGFSELLQDGQDIKNVFHTLKDMNGLTVISGGVMGKNMTAWLDAEKLEHLLEGFQEQADLVIVDSPPSDTADAQILASRMDAALLVIHAGNTRIEPAQDTLKRLQLMGGDAIGAVLKHAAKKMKKDRQAFAWLKTKFIDTNKVEEIRDGIDASKVLPS